MQAAIDYTGPLEIAIQTWKAPSGFSQIINIKVGCKHYPERIAWRTAINDALLAQSAHPELVIEDAIFGRLGPVLIQWDWSHSCDCLARTTFRDTAKLPEIIW